MKYTSLIFTSIIILLTCCKQKEVASNTIFNKDFNWTISIPENFDTVPADEWAKLQKRGKEAIEQTYEQEIENNAKNIFIFKSDDLNYFESNYQPFDPSEGTYDESFYNANNMIYETFHAQMPNIEIDSVSASETIDGLVFKTFRLQIKLPNKIEMKVWMFSRLFDNKEFTVNIMTVDTKKEETLLKAWRASKFGKEKSTAQKL